MMQALSRDGSGLSPAPSSGGIGEALQPGRPVSPVRPSSGISNNGGSQLSSQQVQTLNALSGGIPGMPMTSSPAAGSSAHDRPQPQLAAQNQFRSSSWGSGGGFLPPQRPGSPDQVGSAIHKSETKNTQESIYSILVCICI